MQVDFTRGYYGLTNRNTPDMQHPLQNRHV